MDLLRLRVECAHSRVMKRIEKKTETEADPSIKGHCCSDGWVDRRKGHGERGDRERERERGRDERSPKKRCSQKKEDMKNMKEEEQIDREREIETQRKRKIQRERV